MMATKKRKLITQLVSKLIYILVDKIITFNQDT